MKLTYFKDGAISFITALGISIPTGLIDDILKLLLLALITGFVVPIIRLLFHKLVKYLKDKKVISECDYNFLNNKAKETVDKLEKELQEKLKKDKEEGKINDD